MCGSFEQKVKDGGKGEDKNEKRSEGRRNNLSSNLMLEINFSLLFQLCPINSIVHYNRNTILLIYILNEQCQVYLNDNRMLTPRKRPHTDK